MRRPAALLATVALLAGAAAGPAPAEPPAPGTPAPATWRLENGLTCTLRPVAGAAEAAVVVLFDVGGDHDPEGKSGLAHLVEHLYVTAAAGPTRARTAADLMARYPGRWNAQTGDLYTVVATVVPATDLDAEVREAAARMGSLRITAADVERERPRILEELANMYGGMPGLAALNRAREAARPSPRGGRKGGVDAQVRALTAEDAAAHWSRHYKPRNARVVLAGGFDPVRAAALLREAFGPVAPGEAVPAPGAAPPPAGPAIREESVPAPAPGLVGDVACLAFRAPAPSSNLYAPFLLLAARLLRAPGGGEGVFPPPFLFAPLDDPNVCFASTRPAPGEDAAATVARLEARLAEVASRPLGPEEGRLALEGLGFLLGTASFPEAAWAGNAYGLAFGLGRRAQMGLDPSALAEAVAKVDEAALRRAARDIFDPERRGAVVLRSR